MVSAKYDLMVNILYMPVIFLLASPSHYLSVRVCSLTFLYGAGMIESSSSTLTLKVLPSLIRLSRSDVGMATRTEAISTLGNNVVSRS